jgi:hypothetical protein
METKDIQTGTAKIRPIKLPQIFSLRVLWVSFSGTRLISKDMIKKQKIWTVLENPTYKTKNL